MNRSGGNARLHIITDPFFARLPAAALLLMSDTKAAELGLKPLVRIRACASGGVDPANLPPLLPPPANGLTFEQKQLRRSQGMLIWGIGLTLGGIAIAVGISLSSESDPGAWASGLLFTGVGIALLVGSRVVRPSNGG